MMTTDTYSVEAPVPLVRDAMLDAKAKVLWLYLKSRTGEDGEVRKLAQPHLCKVIGAGVNGKDLREAVRMLEDRGWLKIRRDTKPHRYTVTR